MRIYHIISSFYPLIGGAERATQLVCNGLIGKDYEIEILTTWHHSLDRHEVIGDLEIRRMGFGGSGKLRSLFFGLHTFVHLLCHERSASLIHVQNIDTPLLVGMLLKLLVGKRLVATIHSDQVIPDKQRSILGRFRLFLMRNMVDHFIVVSKSGQAGLLQARIPEERISLIPNGIDTTFFRPPNEKEKLQLRSQHGYNGLDIIVLFLGRLIYSKRADLLLHALLSVRDNKQIKCIIVGDGPESRSLRDLATKLGLDETVHFVGATDHVRDYYWLSDIYVHPSQFEGLSVALLESMACGMIVLVSQCNGNLDVVKDGENGLTFSVDDRQQLAEQLTSLVSKPNYYIDLGQNARDSIETSYGIATVIQSHLNIYQRLLK